MGEGTLLVCAGGVVAIGVSLDVGIAPDGIPLEVASGPVGIANGSCMGVVSLGSSPQADSSSHTINGVRRRSSMSLPIPRKREGHAETAGAGNAFKLGANCTPSKARLWKNFRVGCAILRRSDCLLCCVNLGEQASDVHRDPLYWVFLYPQSMTQCHYALARRLPWVRRYPRFHEVVPERSRAALDRGVRYPRHLSRCHKAALTAARSAQPAGSRHSGEGPVSGRCGSSFRIDSSEDKPCDGTPTFETTLVLVRHLEDDFAEGIALAQVAQRFGRLL